VITLTREEAQQLLEVFELFLEEAEDVTTLENNLVKMLRTRLAQPEPEPQEAIAKWIKTNTEHRQWYICPKCSYQAPRFKDEWQGLTYKERNDCLVEADPCEALLDHEAHELMRTVEAKLKEKNT
jgi:hypothetical protein